LAANSTANLVEVQDSAEFSNSNHVAAVSPSHDRQRLHLIRGGPLDVVDNQKFARTFSRDELQPKSIEAVLKSSDIINLNMMRSALIILNRWSTTAIRRPPYVKIKLPRKSSTIDNNSIEP